MNFDELCKTKELSTDDIKTIVAGALEKGVVYNVPDKFHEDVITNLEKQDWLSIDELVQKFIDSVQEAFR